MERQRTWGAALSCRAPDLQLGGTACVTTAEQPGPVAVRMRQGACGGAGSRHSEVAAWRQLGSTGPEKDAEAGERDREFERARE